MHVFLKSEDVYKRQGYIWALLTIAAKNYQEPEGAEWTREKLVSELLSRQLADGGFGLIKTDPSDVDLTSMVLTALAPYRGQDKTYTCLLYTSRCV